MVVSNKEPMKIILLTYFEIESIVMCILYFMCIEIIGEVLKTCMEPQSKVNKYVVAVVDNENNVVDHLPNRKSGKYVERMFYSSKTDPLNIYDAKVVVHASLEHL